jgi:hypothetical protein
MYTFLEYMLRWLVGQRHFQPNRDQIYDLILWCLTKAEYYSLGDITPTNSEANVITCRRIIFLDSVFEGAHINRECMHL